MATAQFQKEHNDKILRDLAADLSLIDSKAWRMDNLYWIITKDGVKELFAMNRAQRHFFENYLTKPGSIYHRHIILKARQLGFTTFIDLYILDETLFNPNRESLIIAHKQQDAVEIFNKKIEYVMRNMSDSVKGAFFKITKSSARKIQIVIDYGPEQGSTSSIAVSTSGRSGTYFYVHISEFAKLCVMFPQRAAEVETGTFPAVPFDGFIFIESTAEGMAGRFYEMFNDNWLIRNTITPMLSRVKFLPHFYNWQYDDMEMKKITENIPAAEMENGEIDFVEYQIEHSLTDLEITYYYMKYQQMGGKNSVDAVHKLRQEYPTTPEEAFLSTGMPYFPMTKVFSMLQTNVPGEKGEVIVNPEGNLQFEKHTMGSLEIYSMPKKNGRYVIGGDTAEGLAHGDKQVLYVIDQETEKCAAVYVSSIPPDEFVTEAYKIGKFFNWATMGIESNKDGLWVNDGLEKLGYINLYYRKAFDDITKAITKFFGWKTTSATRPFALLALKAVFLRLNDGFANALLMEMSTFIRNAKGKPEAMVGKNDDVVMAASIGYAILQEIGKYVPSVDKAAPSMMKAMFGEQ